MLRILMAVLLIAAVGFGVKTMLGSRSGSAGGAASSGAHSGELITTITKGDRIDVAAHVPDRGVAIVEFTADW